MQKTYIFVFLVCFYLQKEEKFSGRVRLLPKFCTKCPEVSKPVRLVCLFIMRLAENSPSIVFVPLVKINNFLNGIWCWRE